MGLLLWVLLVIAVIWLIIVLVGGLPLWLLLLILILVVIALVNGVGRRY